MDHFKKRRVVNKSITPETMDALKQFSSTPLQPVALQVPHAGASPLISATAVAKQFVGPNIVYNAQAPTVVNVLGNNGTHTNVTPIRQISFTPVPSTPSTPAPSTPDTTNNDDTNNRSAISLGFLFSNWKDKQGRPPKNKVKNVGVTKMNKSMDYTTTNKSSNEGEGKISYAPQPMQQPMFVPSKLSTQPMNQMITNNHQSIHSQQQSEQNPISSTQSTASIQAALQNLSVQHQIAQQRVASPAPSTTSFESFATVDSVARREQQGQHHVVLAPVSSLLPSHAAMDTASQCAPMSHAGPTHNLYAVAFEHAPWAVCVCAANGIFLHANSKFTKLFGYAEHELKPYNLLSLASKEDVDYCSGLIRQMLAGDIHTFHHVIKYLHKNGNVVPSLMSINLVRDPMHGSPMYFVAILQEMSELSTTFNKARPQAMEADSPSSAPVAQVPAGSNSMFSVFDHATVGYIVCSCSARGIIMEYINSRTVAILGYTPQELLNNPLSALLSNLSQSDRQVFEAFLNQLLGGLKPSVEMNINMVSKVAQSDAQEPSSLMQYCNKRLVPVRVQAHLLCSNPVRVIIQMMPTNTL